MRRFLVSAVIAFILTLLAAFLVTRARAATVNGGSPTAAFAAAMVNADGSAFISITYTLPSGRTITRGVSIPVDCTKPILDDRGAQIAAGGSYGTSSTGFCGTIATFASSVSTTVNNAAAAGKLDL